MGTKFLMVRPLFRYNMVVSLKNKIFFYIKQSDIIYSNETIFSFMCIREETIIVTSSFNWGKEIF